MHLKMPSVKCRPFCWYLYACVLGLPQPHLGLLLLFWSKFKFKFFIELTATSVPEMWGLWWQGILYLKKNVSGVKIWTLTEFILNVM